MLMHNVFIRPIGAGPTSVPDPDHRRHRGDGTRTGAARTAERALRRGCRQRAGRDPDARRRRRDPDGEPGRRTPVRLSAAELIGQPIGLCSRTPRWDGVLRACSRRAAPPAGRAESPAQGWNADLSGSLRLGLAERRPYIRDRDPARRQRTARRRGRAAPAEPDARATRRRAHRRPRPHVAAVDRHHAGRRPGRHDHLGQPGLDAVRWAGRSRS